MTSTALRAAALLLASATATLSAHATTYSGADYPFMFMGATGAEVSITTSQVGSFAGAAAIEGFFNGATYSAVLQGPSGALATLDNANSSWSVRFSSFGSPSVSLQASAGGLALLFDVPQEFTSASLMLRSNDGLTILQYSQDNNVSDTAFVNFSTNAIFMADANRGFGQPFMFNAIAAQVPEPSSTLLLGAGLLALVGGARRSRRTRA